MKVWNVNTINFLASAAMHDLISFANDNFRFNINIPVICTFEIVRRLMMSVVIVEFVV